MWLFEHWSREKKRCQRFGMYEGARERENERANVLRLEDDLMYARKRERERIIGGKRASEKDGMKVNIRAVLNCARA